MGLFIYFSLFFNRYDRSEHRKLLAMFVNHYLKPDGVFIIRLLAKNTNTLMTSELVAQLWDNYKEKHTERLPDLHKSSLNPSADSSCSRKHLNVLNQSNIQPFHLEVSKIFEYCIQGQTCFRSFFHKKAYKRPENRTSIWTSSSWVVPESYFSCYITFAWVNKLRTAESRRCPSVGRKKFGKPEKEYHKKDVENFVLLYHSTKKNLWRAFLFFLKVSGISESFGAIHLSGAIISVNQRGGGHRKRKISKIFSVLQHHSNQENCQKAFLLFRKGCIIKKFYA